MFTPLQLEHFRIAKRLRQDRVTRIKITKSHSVAVALRAARLTETRLHAEIKRSAEEAARVDSASLKFSDKNVARYTDPPADTWFDLVLRCETTPEGNRVSVRMNGVEVNSALDKEKRFAKGRILLEQHHEGSVLEVKDLDLREL